MRAGVGFGYWSAHRRLASLRQGVQHEPRTARTTATPGHRAEVRAAGQPRGRGEHGGGWIRPTACCGPGGGGQRRSRDRRGCACAGGSRASWRGGGCSAGRCACSRVCLPVWLDWLESPRPPAGAWPPVAAARSLCTTGTRNPPAASGRPYEGTHRPARHQTGVRRAGRRLVAAGLRCYGADPWPTGGREPCRAAAAEPLSTVEHPRGALPGVRRTFVPAEQCTDVDKPVDARLTAPVTRVSLGDERMRGGERRCPSTR